MGTVRKEVTAGQEELAEMSIAGVVTNMCHSLSNCRSTTGVNPLYIL